MLPSSIELTYFIEIATTLNISRAAERVGVSQPSLSLAVQRLEHSMGTALLVRSRKGVTLTQAGQQLFLHARDLLQRWEKIKTSALASSTEIQGRYIIGCHNSVALYSLPKSITGILKEHSRLELHLVHDLSRRITERVIQAEIDIGIVVNPVRHPDLIIHRLCSDEVALWVKKYEKNTDIFCDNPILICDGELLQTQYILKKLRYSRIVFNRVLNTSSLELISAMTAEGAGIGIIPGRVAEQYALKKYPRTPTFRDEICILIRVENKKIPAIQKIIASIVRWFSEK